MNENFNLVSGLEGNSILIEENCTFSTNTKVSFLKFHNGQGGFGSKICIKKNSNIKSLNITILGANNLLVIGENAQIMGNIMITGSNRKVIIGDNFTCNGVHITCREQDVLIGHDCLFSNEIKIRTSDTHKIYDRDTMSQINISSSPIVIGDKVWIGQGAFISKNVSIPNGCVIGARSLITKSFDEENCVIAGVGGKVLKRNIYWEK